jgi:hypothetical protein
MASTPSSSRTRRPSTTASQQTPRRALIALARHGARIQIAAFTTATETFARWAQTTDQLAQALGDEVLRRVDGETGSAELVGRIRAVSSVHLRELSALPRAAADHFDTRLNGAPDTTRRHQ